MPSVESSSALAFFVAALAGPLAAQVTSRVSVDSVGAQGNGDSYTPFISVDGRYVAFASTADNLVLLDTNGFVDVFVRDRQRGATESVSVAPDGTQGNGDSGDNYGDPSISADGRYVAFHSIASNLVGGDTNGTWDVFVRDRHSGTTERVSVATSGGQGNGASWSPSISADGRFVAFGSDAGNLVSGDTNQYTDVFVRDRRSGTTERVSVDSSGAEADWDSRYPSISIDGRYVAFESDAENLVAGDWNGVNDIFVRDRQTGTTERVSIGSSGLQGNNGSSDPSISADDRYVTFRSAATNLVSGDTNATSDIFVRDRQSGTTERVSVATTGAQGNGMSWYSSISADGRYVTFGSSANNLVTGDTNGGWDVFVRDRHNGVIERVSRDSGGGEGNGQSLYPSISAEGRYVAFRSDASNLVSGDTNGTWDVFVRDLDYSPFVSLCDPGTTGVIACRCSNSPSGPGRGCDNSAGTGGAILAASGVAYLSMDSLVFTTSAELPSEMSIVVQGNALMASGIVFGQGVRCAGATLERLYTKTASGGSITAPDFGAGDPTVSARAAALGAAIEPGQSRWYLVYYRDPIVIGGCPPISTFNATQTGEVAWLP